MRSLARELRRIVDVVVLDFDGTTFDETAEIPVSADLRDLVHTFVAAGGTWIVASGRDFESLTADLANSFACSPHALVVLDQLVIRSERGSFREDVLHNSAVRAQLASSFAGVEREVGRVRDRVRDTVGDVVYEDTLSPFCVATRTVAELELVERIAHEEISAPWFCFARNSTYGRVARRGIDKGSCVRHLVRGLGLGASRVAAAGDDRNDLSILTPRTARWMVAPANAVEPVRRRVARHGGEISSLRAADGVVEALSRLVKRNA